MCVWTAPELRTIPIVKRKARQHPVASPEVYPDVVRYEGVDVPAAIQLENDNRRSLTSRIMFALYRSAPTSPSTVLAIASSLSHVEKHPPNSPPQALKDQSAPRMFRSPSCWGLHFRWPVPSTTNIGPVSRIHASSCSITIISIPAASRWVRANSKWLEGTPTATGSKRAIAFATPAKANCAGRAAAFQVSGRVGHSIQVLKDNKGMETFREFTASSYYVKRGYDRAVLP